MSVDFTPSRGEYTELKPFRYWCQKVLPLVYDDSLSYYELLSKVLDSLNKALEDVETLNDDVTALYTAYTSLQNWVNNYVETFFEGEGIENAVDDAIDRMVVSGEFGSIVNDKVAAQINAVVASQIGGTVQTQLPGVVGAQINPVVANQLPGVVNNSLGDVADAWLQAHVQSQTGTLDQTINSSGSAPLSFPLKNLIQGVKGAYSFIDKYLLADYTDTDYHNDVIIFRNIFKDNLNPPEYPYGVRSKFYKKGNKLVMTSYPDPSDDNPWEINAYPSVIPITRNLIPPLSDDWDASTNDAVALTVSGLSGLDKNAINKYFVNINSGDTIRVAFDLNLTHEGDFNGFISLEHWKLIKVYVSNNAVMSQDLTEFTLTANSSGAGTLLSKVHGECEYTFGNIDKETPGNPDTIGFGLAIVTGENISWGHYSGNTNYMARSNTYDMTITGEVVDTEVDDLNERIDKIVVFNETVNKINPADKTHGAILDDGTVSTYGAWNDYDTSDFIPVKAGTAYTAYFANESGAITLEGARIMYLLLNSNKEPLTHSNTVTSLKTITPSVNGYIRVSSAVSNFSTYLMLIEETTTIPYTAYSPESTVFAEDVEFNSTQIDVIKNEAEDVLNDYLAEGAINVNISGNTITLKSKLNDYKVEHTLYKETPNRNHLPQFYIDKIYNSENVQIATKPADDDIAPIRIRFFEAVGANHGYPFGYKMTKNGQTSADIGSVWTDGTTDYLLYAVDDTYAYLAAPYGVYSGNLRPNTDAPTTDLTAKSGATHTGTISISGYTRGNQILPSVNNIKTTLYADGEIISGDYTGSCKEFILDNEYGVISYVGMWEYMTTHVGNVVIDDIPDIVNIHIRTTFKPGGKCFVSTTLYAVSAVTLADCGFLQAQPLTVPSGGSIWRYINGLNAIDGYDFSDFINITSYNVDLIATANDLADNTVPPNRLVDWIYDSSNNKVVGFTLGYVADIADGENDKRLLHTTRLWDIRKSKKTYPIAVSGYQMLAGASITVCGYRNYLYPTDLINDNVYEYGNAVYASIDAKDGMKVLPLDGKYSGYKVDVIDESSAEVINEAVSTGIIVDVDSCGGANVKLS